MVQTSTDLTESCHVQPMRVILRLPSPHYAISRNLPVVIFLYFPRHRRLVVRLSAGKWRPAIIHEAACAPSRSLRCALPYLRCTDAAPLICFISPFIRPGGSTSTTTSSRRLLAFLPVTLWILASLVQHDVMDRMF